MVYAENELNWRALPSKRPLDWRFRQAQADARRSRLRLSGGKECGISWFANGLRRIEACGNDEERRLAFQHAHCRRLQAPLQIVGDRETASSVDAWLLAKELPAAIARRLALPADAVDCYAHFFFDVAERLDDREFIIHQAILPERKLGAPETSRHRIEEVCGLLLRT
jgi:hypothetical protein